MNQISNIEKAKQLDSLATLMLLSAQTIEIRTGVNLSAEKRYMLYIDDQAADCVKTNENSSEPCKRCADFWTAFYEKPNTLCFGITPEYKNIIVQGAKCEQGDTQDCAQFRLLWQKYLGENGKNI